MKQKTQKQLVTVLKSTDLTIECEPILIDAEINQYFSPVPGGTPTHIEVCRDDAGWLTDPEWGPRIVPLKRVLFQLGETPHKPMAQWCKSTFI